MLFRTISERGLKEYSYISKQHLENQAVLGDNDVLGLLYNLLDYQ